MAKAEAASLREAFEIMEREQRDEYLEHLERRIDAHIANAEWHASNDAWLAKLRAEVLAMPLPRNTCPGCFAAIYELAADDGWCWDCNPTRRVDSRRAPNSTKEK